MELDLKSLEIFKAVVDEGSVSKAAQKLNRVQSNISTRIKQLEDSTQKQLFFRTGRLLKLTSDGALLLTYAEQFLALKEATTTALNDKEPRGIFRIGAMESTAAARLPKVLAKYNELFPQVKVDLITDTAGGLQERLKRVELDCIFVADPIISQNFESAPIYQEDLVLVTPKGFSEILNYDQLEGQTLIAFEKGCAYRKYLEDWVDSHNIRPSNILSMNSYLAMFSCVSAGTGFAVAPQSVLRLFRDAFPLQQHAIGDQFQNIETLLMWNKGYQTKNLAVLKDLLQL